MEPDMIVLATYETNIPGVVIELVVPRDDVEMVVDDYTPVRYVGTQTLRVVRKP